MIPGEYSATLIRGDSWSIKVQPTNQDGSLRDLTGWTARAQVRTKPDSAAILVEIETVVESDGIALAMSPEDTATLNGQVVWDLETTDADSIVRTLLAGTFTMWPDVTREP